MDLTYLAVIILSFTIAYRFSGHVKSHALKWKNSYHVEHWTMVLFDIRNIKYTMKYVCKIVKS